MTRGWETELNLTKTIKEDLKFKYDNIEMDNGQPIVSYKTGISLNEIINL